jgi:hypothetical protein
MTFIEAINEVPLSRQQRDTIWVIIVIFRWLTCKHPRIFWQNGIDGYRCPDCKRDGYLHNPFYDPNFRSP